MDTGIKLRVVTPSGPVVDALADAITARTEVGEFCVLPEHLPILASLTPGRFVVDLSGDLKVYAIDVGFFEGGAHHVNVMTQHCISKEDLIENLEVLDEEYEMLTEELNSLEDDSPARATVRSSLLWVEAQLSVARE